MHQFPTDDQSRELLTQLVALLLQSQHTDSGGKSSSGGLQRALLELCQLTGHRLDGLHLDKLEAALKATAAALCASSSSATAAAGGEVADASSAGRSSSLDRVGSSSSGGTAGGGACVMEEDASQSAPVTPAAPRARSRLAALSTGPAPKPQAAAAAATPATAAKKAPRSRLAAMSALKAPPQRSADEGEGEDDGASALAGLMAARLKLDDGGSSASSSGRDENAAPASLRAPAGPNKAAAASRRVRFDAAAAEEEPGPHAAPAVPPSVARHAVRRERLCGGGGGGVLEPLEEPVRGGQAAAAAAKPPAARGGGRSRLGATAAAHAASSATRPSCGAGSSSSSADGGGPWRPAVVLLVEAPLHQLPWESCPGISQQHHIYRCPSLSVAAATALRNSAGSAGGGGSAEGVPAVAPTLDLSSAYFLLNPDGDLPATQESFQSWLQADLGLRGTAGRRPAAAALAAELRARDVFLYFGHGGGEQYVRHPALRRLPRCAGGLLMGCSSGRLRENGKYEPGGAIWSYLLGGCPAAVANLWDVTDRCVRVCDSWRCGCGGCVGSGGGGGGGGGVGGVPDPMLMLLLLP